MTLKLTSPAFTNNGEIPRQYSCDGDDISPPLVWSGVPTEAKSLVLIMDDPDAPDPLAPRMTWVHWVLYNLLCSSTGLVEDCAKHGLPPGTLEGVNDWKRSGYGGPCPPVGRHRYFYKLYALDMVLPDFKSPTKGKIEAEMHGHVLDHAELIATYQQQ